MKFSSFLRNAFNQAFWNQQKSISFEGNEFPPFFFDLLFKKMVAEKILAAKPSSIFLQSQSAEGLRAILGQSILGESKLFWLGNISEFIKTQKKFSLSELEHYHGPNSIIYFVSSKEANKTSISIDNTINKETAMFIGKSFTEQASKKIDYVVETVFQKFKTLDLNATCKLLHYAPLMSSKELKSAIPYTLSILSSKNSSLFELSENFFSYKSQPFFALWSILEKQYPPMFWVSYWSEQIWKAYYTRLYLQQKNFVAAKKISYRLPHSFINKTWKNFTLEQLRYLHQKLYNIDFAIKKGSSFYSLDLFYLAHFIKGD